MQRVFVLDRNQQPLMPCSPARARQLLRNGKAAVFRRFPFTLILKDREGGDTQPLEFKADPGSTTTGITLVAEFKTDRRVIWAAHLNHRGQRIKAALDSRRALRRNRRNRKTRYRPSRFDNRRRPDGWLPPSLKSRVYNVQTWYLRLCRFSPVTTAAVETVRFDTQALVNPEISGVEYQQGELLGYEVREYVLEKWGRTCAYCDAENVPLEVEHIQSRARGGSNRVSNLTLACRPCNQAKNSQDVRAFLDPDPQRLARLLAIAQAPLKAAAAVNATRYAIGNALKASGLPVTFWSGGRTKHNRVKQGHPKEHWIDAACIGETGAAVSIPPALKPLLITAQGHGKRQRCVTDKHGFPKAYAPRAKTFQGWRTGDLVKAVITAGKFAGRHCGRIAIRYRPSFRLNGFDVHPKYLHLLQRADGYAYALFA